MSSKIKEINKDMPHLGSLALNHIEQSGNTRHAVAKKIDISPISVNRYVKERSLHGYILFNISKCINVNLFDVIAHDASLEGVARVTNKEQQLLQRIADLEKELAIYKEIVLGRKG